VVFAVSQNPESKPAESVLLADHERWYAAISYLFFFCFLGLWKARDSAYIRFHSRQAFLLFLGEIVALFAIFILDRTVGRLPVLGLLLIILLQIVVYMSALLLSVMGFVKALFGEKWILPFFGHFSQRVPLI
jgi:uncharacterized membrane protein